MKRPAKKKAKTTKSKAKGRLRSSLPLLAGVVVGLAVVAGLAVLPARTWVSQRSATGEAEANRDRAAARVDELNAQLELLQTDSEIERMARENFDLVYPGEESYRILPPPSD